MYKYCPASSRALSLVVLCCSIGVVGCKKSQSSHRSQPSAQSTAQPVASAAPSVSIVRIAAFHDGTLQLDGAKMTENEVVSVLSGLDPQHTIIWYYREAPKEPPHPTVQRLVQTIADFGFPISLSTQPDFSDVVDANKQTRPRINR